LYSRWGAIEQARRELTKKNVHIIATIMSEEDAPPTMFDVVAKRDYDAMVQMYATNAQNAIVSYLAMRSRWKSSSSLADQGESKSGKIQYKFYVLTFFGLQLFPTEQRAHDTRDLPAQTCS
jgi:hypothetical protein